MSNAAAILPIVNQARRLLAGQPAQVQGVVLADLLATYLAGHTVPGDPAETAALRDHLLEAHIAVVRQLIPINARQIHGHD